jgi:hypothetical protein
MHPPSPPVQLPVEACQQAAAAALSHIGAYNAPDTHNKHCCCGCHSRVHTCAVYAAQIPHLPQPRRQQAQHSRQFHNLAPART